MTRQKKRRSNIYRRLPVGWIQMPENSEQIIQFLQPKIFMHNTRESCKILSQYGGAVSCRKSRENFAKLHGKLDFLCDSNPDRRRNETFHPENELLNILLTFMQYFIIENTNHSHTKKIYFMFDRVEGPSFQWQTLNREHISSKRCFGLRRIFGFFSISAFAEVIYSRKLNRHTSM